MQVALIPHPSLPHPDIRITACARRHTADLLLDYFIKGQDVDSIRVPERHSDPYGERRYGLWEHTCFEAFARGIADPSYCEINISPSGDWASYLFDRYREGMRDGPRIDGPYSDTYVWRGGGAVQATYDMANPHGSRLLISAGAGIEIQSTYDMSMVPGLPTDEPWMLGLSAVIEEECGRKSWWALAHPDPDKPDFHHPDGFVLELPPAE